jgi:hypothetical protein
MPRRDRRAHLRPLMLRSDAHGSGQCYGIAKKSPIAPQTGKINQSGGLSSRAGHLPGEHRRAAVRARMSRCSARWPGARLSKLPAERCCPHATGRTQLTTSTSSGVLCSRASEVCAQYYAMSRLQPTGQPGSASAYRSANHQRPGPSGRSGGARPARPRPGSALHCGRVF